MKNFGLALARTLAESLGGSLAMDASQKDNCFVLSLPIGNIGDVYDRVQHSFLFRESFQEQIWGIAQGFHEMIILL